ncbi:MAG: hypothetical protein QOE24_785 [Frankiales bacterium]|jgi:DNA-binding FadR family transcriptional regulator|nr:hypothetical protein [Frankiales bacterium]MDX6208394.1 hypothetical protein [Frankiales bacterium]MDX6221747.1 hypothetical protein [Frankiales bacterium]
MAKQETLAGINLKALAVEVHAVPDSAQVSETMFRAIRGTTALEETVERLLHAIKVGILVPGERLPGERELVLRFRVGRATLREALAALREAELIESRPGRGGGSFVRRDALDLSAKRLAGRPALAPSLYDVLTFRRAVEVEAARSAAGRALTEEDRDHLLSCLDRTTQAQPDHYRQVDSRLHLAIAEMSGSRLLVQAVTEAEVFVHDLLAATPLIPTKLQHSNQQHRLIVDAVVAGNPDAAQLYMADHLEATAAMLRGFFSQVEAPANPSERSRSKRATSPRVRRPQ